MRIYCPKCNVGYEIDEALIPENGKKLRCSYCHAVFTAHREDLRETPNIASVTEMSAADESETSKTEEPVAEKTTEKPAEDTEMKDIFARLSSHTEQLFETEKKLPWTQKIVLKAKQNLGLLRKQNQRLSLIAILCFVVLVFYNYRYEIVRTAPFMNGIYRLVNIKARIPGEGLDFQNVVWKDFEDDFVRKLEVKGFIVNNTSHDITVPVLHVEMLDAETGVLQSMNQKPAVNVLKPGGRVAISVIVKKPAPMTKYVYLTFVDED